MIELQKLIQDWIPATRYKVSHRSLVGRGLCYPYFGGMGYKNVFDPLPPPSTYTHTQTHTHTHKHTHTHSLQSWNLLRIKIKNQNINCFYCWVSFSRIVCHLSPQTNFFFSHAQHTQPEHLGQTRFIGTTFKPSL